MAKFLFAMAMMALLVTSIPQISYADMIHDAFPLNQSITIHGFRIGSRVSLRTTCTVNKDDRESVYSYIIEINYKTDKRRLLAWDFLDWILSQYSNAIETQYAASNLFPLNVGEGSYVFRFESPESPLWFKRTLVEIFPHESPSADEAKHTKEKAEEYSGVSVSPYDYIPVEIALGAYACLPKNLLVFPNSARSGF